MAILNNLAQRLKLDDPEERQIVDNVGWSQYEALLADLGDASHYRVNYLDGILEIVSPSRRHENLKTRTGDLLLIYFLETNTEYFPTGSTTFRKQEVQASGEPDESYCIGADKEFPDLVIEVVVTSGGINRLELYRRLGVQEVWIWQKEQLFIYQLREEVPSQFAQTFGYELCSGSALLPKLNVPLLVECVKNPSPLAAAKAFRAGLS
jgi:Uma2 family endonuclease